jgi:hypothetical protein
VTYIDSSVVLAEVCMPAQDSGIPPSFRAGCLHTSLEPTAKGSTNEYN